MTDLWYVAPVPRRIWQSVAARCLVAGCLLPRSLPVICAALLATPSPVPARDTTSVRIVLVTPMRVLDPVLSSAYVVRNHGYLVYDTLLAMDSQSRPMPQMVDRWEVSADKMTYIFTLRKGLRFHDGTDVTSEDVIASLQRWGQRDQIGGRLLAATEAMTAPRSDVFIIRLKQPFGLILEALAKQGSPVPFIMPKRLAMTPASQAITEVVGSGPYQFVAADYQPGVKATYTKFNSYVPRKEPANGFAGGKIAIADRIELVNISDSQTAVHALRTGEIDFMEDVPPDLMPQLAQARDIRVKSYGEGTEMFTMRMNWLQPPFNNVKTRLAALAALNQLDYLDAQVGDPKAYKICGAVLTCRSAYASEEFATQIKAPNLARAKALLKESGYDGAKVVILNPTDVPSSTSLASVTAQALRKIGMNVELQSMDFATMQARRTKKESTDQGGWSIFHSTWSALDLLTPVVNPNLDGRGGDGYAGWSGSEQLEALRGKFAQEADLAKRKQIALAVQRLNYEQVFYVPLGSYSRFRGYNLKLASMVDAPIPLFWSSGK